MKKNSKNYLIIVAIVVLLEVIPVTRAALKQAVIYVTRPIISTVSSSAQRSSGLLSGVFEISSLKRENSELAAKLITSQVDTAKIAELEHENDVLKEQLGFLEEHQETGLIPARIIGREPFGTMDKIIIDKGQDDGVKEKSAVVSDGFFIGKVNKTYASQSEITLITSKDSIAQAMLQKSRTLGIIKGSLDGVKLENIPQDTVSEEREAVVTSGLGGEIAAGILIGWVSGESSSESEIYKILNVEIAQDLNKLEYVFIVK